MSIKPILSLTVNIYPGQLTNDEFDELVHAYETADLKTIIDEAVTDAIRERVPSTPYGHEEPDWFNVEVIEV